MPKKFPEDLNDRIAAVIARHREGVGIDDLYAALADIVSRRTLQRRLGELADQGHVSAMGEGRARVYRALASADVHQITGAGGIESGEAVGTPTVEVYVPVSPESRDTLNYIRQPIQKRKPVGYDRMFLE